MIFRELLHAQEVALVKRRVLEDRYMWVDPHDDASLSANGAEFARQVAPARTFGFLEEVEALRNLGLARGGSLENAIILTPEGGIMNRDGLRFGDEFVRHKIMDIIGDLALFGMPVLGRVHAERTGHGVHTALVSRVLRDDSAWEIIDSSHVEKSFRA